jgi:hypothetical protein
LLLFARWGYSGALAARWLYRHLRITIRTLIPIPAVARTGTTTGTIIPRVNHQQQGHLTSV